MFRPEVTSRLRRALPALAIASALAVPAFAPEHAAAAVVRTDMPGPGLGSLEPLAPVADPALRERVEGMQPLVQAGEPTIERVEEVAERVVLGTRPQFPVVGDFNWGQSGAQFGAGRSGRTHEGQDVFARTGTPLVAVRKGKVVESGNDGGRGNYVAIYSPEARQTYVYLHMNRPTPVSPGERVQSGEGVGAVGCTGSCFGTHLHFEVRSGEGTQAPPIDPEPLLARWAQRSQSRPVLAPGTN
jgi:murein DD-endopeptidase MepM/ murein hydrolase activator NlpD